MKIISKFFPVLFFSMAALSLFAQSSASFGYRKTEAQNDTFVQRVNGTGLLTAAIQATDGGYVTASKIDSLSFLVRKIKASGQKQWERRLDFQDNSYNPDAFIRGITQTTDGGFVLAGRVGCRLATDCGYGIAPMTAYPEFSRLGGAILVKLNANGTIAWGKGLGALFFASVSSTSDGGVIATGLTGANEFIARFNAAGGVVWEKSFGNLNSMPFVVYSTGDFHSTATSDNAFIVASQTFALRNHVITPTGVDVMKITDSGSVIWEKLVKSDDFVFQSSGMAANQGVILIGTSLDSNKLKALVMRANGTIIWKAGYFLEVPGKPAFVSSSVQTSDGGYIVTGSRSGPKLSGFIAKIDSSKKIAFQNTFEASGGLVFGTADGGFLLFAGITSDILISKINSEANAAGCSFFSSIGPTTNTSFGSVRIDEAHSPSGDTSFKLVDLGLSSVVTSHPVTNICH